MARPTCEQEIELEWLETASIALAGALEMAEVLGIRFEQALIRALGDDHLLRVLCPGPRQVTALKEDLKVCRGLLNDVLAKRQEERTIANKGGKG